MGRNAGSATLGGQCPGRPPSERPTSSQPAGPTVAQNRRANLDDHASTGLNRAPWMAGVAQLVERQVVVLDAVGSSPIARPIRPT